MRTTSPRTGRPTILGERKSVKVGFKITPTTDRKLAECAKRLGKERVAVIEQGIDMVYESLEPKKDNE